MAVDFRKGIGGLSSLVLEIEDIDVRKDVFVFYNRNFSKLKIIAWHRNGFIMIYKCLDKKKFTISGDGNILLSSEQYN